MNSPSVKISANGLFLFFHIQKYVWGVMLETDL